MSSRGKSRKPRRLTKEDRAKRDERNQRRGRTSAYIKAQQWEREQRRKAIKRAQEARRKLWGGRV
jgi:hypothetical protein